LPQNAAIEAACCLRLRCAMPSKTLNRGSAAPPALGKTLGRRFAEPSAWTRGKFLPPPKNLPHCKRQTKEQNISMRQILVEKYIIYPQKHPHASASTSLIQSSTVNIGFLGIYGHHLPNLRIQYKCQRLSKSA